MTVGVNWPPTIGTHVEVPPVAVTLAPQAAALFPLTLTPFSTPYVLTNVAPARDCVLWDAVLLRLDMRDYQDFRGKGFPLKVWEELRFFDPYYHVQVREDWAGGVDPKDGWNVGFSFNAVLLRLSQLYPKAKTTEKCLRWYLMRLRQADAGFAKYKMVTRFKRPKSKT